MLFNSYVFLFAFFRVTYLVFWTLAECRVALCLAGSYRLRLLRVLERLVLPLDGVLHAGQLSGRPGLPFGHEPAIAKVVPDRFQSWLTCRCSAISSTPGFSSRRFKRQAGQLGVSSNFTIPDIVLPVGISFYTFHTITYIVDSYRGDHSTNAGTCSSSAAYVSLFSQLVAGPIVRFRQMRSRPREPRDSRSDTLAADLACSFFVIGLVEKVVVADTLASLVDPALAALCRTVNPRSLAAPCSATACSSTSTSAATATWQSGSDISSVFESRMNFNSPYKALDPCRLLATLAHLALDLPARLSVHPARWEQRRGPAKTYQNLLVTMLLGGLWHGANWTFVLWGAYTGLC